MYKMSQTIEAINRLMNTSSKNDKQRILKESEHIPLFKETILFLLNPFVLTGISNKKVNKPIAYSTAPITDWESMMLYFNTNNTGTDIDISIVRGFIDAQPEQYREIYTKLITKTLKLGCDGKTVNKVYKDFIPVFDVQLGTALKHCKIKQGIEFSLSRKLNGCRCVFYQGKLYTRTGKEYTGVQHIINSIYQLGVTDNTVLDGELLYKNKEGLTDSEAFQKGTGIANSKALEKPELMYCIFDILPADEFKAGKSTDTYFTRKVELESLRDFLSNNADENLSIVQMVYQGTDQSKIQEWLDYAENNDWEGVMINLDTPYECKRTKKLIKVKCFYECDIRCIGVNKGDVGTKYENTLGSISCLFKDNTVSVGSGFSDELRNQIWNDNDIVLDKIITVRYKEETKNKSGGISIQFPVFVCIRTDKDEESYE